MKKQLLFCSALGLLAVPPLLVGNEPADVPRPPVEAASCPISAYEHLKGEKQKDLPRLMEKIPPDKKAQTIRIICHGCAVTMDYSPTRLNIQLDKSDHVSNLTCG